MVRDCVTCYNGNGFVTGQSLTIVTPRSPPARSGSRLVSDSPDRLRRERRGLAPLAAAFGLSAAAFRVQAQGALRGAAALIVQGLIWSHLRLQARHISEGMERGLFGHFERSQGHLSAPLRKRKRGLNFKMPVRLREGSI